jgi:hypothetical protein
MTCSCKTCIVFRSDSDCTRTFLLSVWNIQDIYSRFPLSFPFCCLLFLPFPASPKSYSPQIIRYSNQIPLTLTMILIILFCSSLSLNGFGIVHRYLFWPYWCFLLIYCTCSSVVPILDLTCLIIYNSFKNIKGFLLYLLLVNINYWTCPVL